MDPVTAFGLAGTILTFIDYGYKTVVVARDIYNSAKGATPDNERLQQVTQDARDHAALIEARYATVCATDAEFQQLVRCASDYIKICDTLLELLESLRARNAK
jgi:regulator of extracellular matrix RemA (YlzA/DUF370 family)